MSTEGNDKFIPDPERYVTQRSPRYRTKYGAPGRMCKCGHREGSHNELARCCAGECSCGNGDRYSPDYGGFSPVEVIVQPSKDRVEE